jgi:hypothetical protein
MSEGVIMKCVCSDGKAHCYGLGIVDMLIVVLKDVSVFTFTCNEDVEEIDANPRLVIVKNERDSNGTKRGLYGYTHEEVLVQPIQTM